jgi:branched-chain amino acid transport system permease protein
LGILIVIENVIAMVFGNESLNIPRNNAWSVNLGPITLSDMQILPFAIGFIIVAILWVSVRRLRIFRALWAIGDQPELISALGLPLFFLRGLALMLSTILTAIPASLLCLDGRADPHIGMEYLLIAAVAVLVGGMNSYVGWVSGAVALAVLKSLVVWKFSSQWTDLVTFTLLVGILLFRPRGLLESTKRIEDAL